MIVKELIEALKKADRNAYLVINDSVVGGVSEPLVGNVADGWTHRYFVESPKGYDYGIRFKLYQPVDLKIKDLLPVLERADSAAHVLIGEEVTGGLSAPLTGKIKDGRFMRAKRHDQGKASYLDRALTFTHFSEYSDGTVDVSHYWP